ncbi:LytR/AlgR family response regulator transcription factor [Flavobacterium restrictum]|uniref:Response regulator n=1 Tax=Flavobacterium restrictum TaxID=2594428 RepID=A0A553DY55_9FLAO|nr:LytTR family DNA-binding domain-containing protein [Flavobacterium restrictum]TRX37738.1 response regulator [Flavobacterium restrictum]
MTYSYIIIDDNEDSILKTKAVADCFLELSFVGKAQNYEDGLNLILEYNPQLVFLEIDPTDPNSNLSITLLNELHRYLNVIPKIIITTTKKDFTYECIKHQVTDYFIKPVARIDLIKLLLKLDKSVPQEDPKPATNTINPEKPVQLQAQQPLVLCIKSYGDYRYINANDICYLQADNNSTDLHLNNGEIVTAFKTLKHFEALVPQPFVRIHNSYIVNKNYISRIHTGNTVCYIKNTTTKLPFSKTYKTNIDLIISEISAGNYLEI